MRFFVPPLALLAATLVATAMPVRAKERSGWVDPPAKAGQEVESLQTTSAGPAAPPKPADADTAAAKETPVQDAPARNTLARTARRPERPDVRVVEESPRRAARSPRRLADTVTGMPAAQAAPARQGASEVDTDQPRIASLAGTARSLMSDYLDAVSSRAGIQDSARFYGDLVRFHGRLMTRSALMAEKARFARRWPDRRYEPRGEPRTACNAASATCVVTTPFDFRASNPDRGARSAGTGELALTVGFAGDRAVILSENSRVVRRGTAALAAGRSGSGA